MFIYRYMAGFVETVVGGENDANYDPHKFRKVPKPTTYGETMMHLLKGCFGAGLLAMPNAVGRLGIIIGPISVVLLGIFATYCLQILIKGQYEMCKKLKRGYIGYPKAMRMAAKTGPKCMRWCGPFFSFSVVFMLVLWQIGICSLYFVFVAESADQILSYYGIQTTVRTIIGIEFPILLVINMIRDLKLLTPFSTVSNFLMLIGILLVFFYLIQDDVTIEQYKLDVKGLNEFPIFIGITLFAMEAVGVVLALEYNMENPSRFVGLFGLLSIGMFILTVTFTVLGAFGYLKYGSKIESVITLNLPVEEKKAQLSKGAFALALFLSFPLQSVVAYQILWAKLQKKFPPKSSRRFIADYILRTMLTVVPFAIALSAPALGPFMGLLGALCLSILAVIFPAILDAAVYYPDQYGPMKVRLISDIIIVIIGVFCLFSGIYTSVLELVNSP